jgi:anti-anti-sigma factor
VAGEVDHSNHGRIRKHLEAALDHALRSPDAPTDITLDLSTLRFLDVASAVNLVHAAEQFPDAHRLVITGVRPRVQRVLDRCGAPFAPQLVVLPRSDAPDTR